MQQAAHGLAIPQLREAIALRCQNPLGRAQGLGLTPFSQRSAALNRIRLILEMRGQIEAGAPPPVAGAQDVEVDLQQADKQTVLESQQLVALGETMYAAAAIKRYLLPLDALAPLLYGLGASLADLGRPAQRILDSFEPSGRLADDASATLGQLRQRARAIEDSVQDTLHSIMAMSKVKKVLQEPYFTQRSERYVLPVIASFQGQLAGIVHDASHSGQTVFIEPQAMVDIGNRLKIAQSEVKEEEFRILTELTEVVAQHSEDIRHAMTVIGRIDFLSAAAQLAIDLDCEAIIPDEKPMIDLIDARHPILILQKLTDPDAPLVANNIGLLPNQNVLILTGPNTGGKTVAMKTVGLMALMLRCGLHIPCDKRSKLAWFRDIDVAIGDQQSIESKLSTFAAHIKLISRIVTHAKPGSLILIDEIAADTDPKQGQALAQAVLETLAEKGAHVIVTSHFEGLKAIPFANPRFRNAGVGFDAAKFRPTYRISLDVPQSSNGFDIAKSLGMSDLVITRAKALIGHAAQGIETLMKALETRNAELDFEKQQAQDAATKHAEEQARLEEEAAALERERKTLKNQAHDALFDEIKATRGEVRSIIAELQKTVGGEAVRDAMRAANQAAQDLFQVEDIAKKQAEAQSDSPEKGLLDSPVAVGSWVHVPKIGQDGRVVSFDKKNALVALGNMRIKVAVKSLRKAHRPAAKAPKARSRPAQSRGAASAASVVAIGLGEEIDLRGLNVDEALARLDGFLDHHYQGTTQHVRVIHGHGTGVLRDAIRAQLKRSGYVNDFQREEEKQGGNGATLVTLSDE